jgi:hypothetical protein
VLRGQSAAPLLYDQTTNPAGDNVDSQDYEDAGNAAGDQAADDSSCRPIS